MEYHLIDNNPNMIAAWKEFFQAQTAIKIYQGDLTATTCDAIVSPANSFGFMDGGVDYAISERLGWDLQQEVQKQIQALPLGELLVGEAMIVTTNDAIIRNLVVAPTMRVPTNFNIATSINAYLAMKAVLTTVAQHGGIKKIAMTGFCTGIGRMQPMIAARQMFYAYKEIVLGEKKMFENFGDAQRYHWEINPQGMIYTH